MYLRWMDAFECQDVMHPTGGLELLQLYWRICFSRDLFQSYSGVKCSSRKPKYFVQYHLCVCVLLFRDGKDGAIARLLGSVKMSKCVIPENAVLKRAYFSESSLQVSVACVKGENWLLTIPSVPLSETNLPLLKLNSIWTLHLAKGMKIRMMTLHNKAFEQPELQIQVPADHATSGCWFLCLCDQWIRLSRELSNPYIRDRGVSSKSRIYILSDLQTKFSIHMMVCRAKYNSQEQ